MPRTYHDPGGFVLAMALFLAALVVRLFVPPWTHYTFNDEYYYLRLAVELRDTGVVHLQNQPPLLLYLYALAFQVFPANAVTTSALTSVIGSLSAPAFYACLRSLRVERGIALLAAVLLVLHPLHIKHSGASSLEVVSLFLILCTVGTYARWLRGPGLASVLAFGLSLFAALLTRLENFALVPALAFVAVLHSPRRFGRGEILLLSSLVALALSYVPHAVSFHTTGLHTWRSGLGLVPLVVNNLGFWVGGSLATGKLPLLLLGVGLLAGWRTHRRAVWVWLTLFGAYSLIYAVYGLNLGYHQELGHGAYYGARSAGHDAFRFNVILLPTALLFVATGIITVLRLLGETLARLHDRPLAASGALAVVVGVAALLLGTNGEWRAYDPAAFLRSSYNRPIEIEESAFLRTSLAGVPRPARAYMLRAGTEPFVDDEIEILPIQRPADVRIDDGPTYFYVNSLQLGRRRARAVFAAVARSVRLETVASKTDGTIGYRLFRVSPPGVASAVGSDPAGPHPVAGRGGRPR